ncbi:MAG: hypothetical protein EZS28_019314 [Streblomastix strix]|uniref:Uncharacterized protein n=1 Tax=Streblomastix strix TaxID=222440 RepID=A0A5J4VRY7_9EUKA|nr:MAG: hypothetical protein EZS28_019314 [Streblomastix strix]
MIKKAKKMKMQIVKKVKVNAMIIKIKQKTKRKKKQLIRKTTQKMIKSLFSPYLFDCPTILLVFDQIEEIVIIVNYQHQNYQTELNQLIAMIGKLMREKLQLDLLIFYVAFFPNSNYCYYYLFQDYCCYYCLHNQFHVCGGGCAYDDEHDEHDVNVCIHECVNANVDLLYIIGVFGKISSVLFKCTGVDVIVDGQGGRGGRGGVSAIIVP